MPQFDPSHYASQIFWLLICFSVVLGYTFFYSLPRLRRLLEERWQYTEGYQVEALKLRDESDVLQSLVEEDLQGARKSAAEIFNTVVRLETDTLNQKKNEIITGIKARLVKAEKQMIKERLKVLDGIRPYTLELTIDLLQRILPTHIPQKSIDSTLDDKIGLKAVGRA